ncbi:MAG TPA: hypothetical protein VK957_09655 [Lunatimonas sp.]|nr:hypothetical protein [Lunatimonas sp.]
MKKLWIAIIMLPVVFSCTNRSAEDRFIFEDERILDMETGDEYYINKMDTLTLVNIEGESSEIVVTATPFSDSDELNKMMASYREKITERKDALYKDQKEKIKAERAERYAEYDDQELLTLFNKLHSEDVPYEQQMDVIAELVRREAVLETDAAKLLEVDTVTLDFDIDYTVSEDTE